MPFASRANAAASDFPGTLYLGGGSSGVVAGSFGLGTAAGPGTPTSAPTLAAQAGGSMFTGAWTYAFAYVGAAGETPVGPTASVNLVAGTQQVQVTVPAAPAGVTAVKVYRQRGTNPLNLVATLTPPTTWFVDNAAEPTVGTWTQPPQPQNRLVAVSPVAPACTATSCGYIDFSAATYQATTTANDTPSATASTTPTNKGWITNVAGPVSFRDGNWTFRVQIKTTAATSGTAHLVVGMWKVSVSGGAVSAPTLILDPNAAGEQTTTNLVTAASGIQTVTHTVALPTVSLAAGERLYVQFWRHQTAPSTGGTSAARTMTMYAYDGVTSIDHPAADDAAPSAFSLSAPASGASIKNGQALQSNPSDPSPGSGLASVQYFYCLPLVDCTFAPNRVSIASVASSPWSSSWAGQPADGTYQLVARATDRVGNAVDTGVIPVTVDNTAPDTSFGSTPSNPSSASPTFAISSGEAGVTFECSLDGGAFASCAASYAPGPLASGAHTVQARAVDGAGNIDATPASFSWTVDATAPTVNFTSTPANPSASASATFSFTSSEAGTFTCSLDGAAFAACSSPRSLSGLADGSHTFSVRSTDGVGNVGTASSSWTIDTTTPVVTVSSAPAARTSSSTATFAFSSNEPATLECRLDGAAFAACSSPQTLTVGDGAHTFDIRATDSVGHVGSASGTWTIDTTAPGPPLLDSPKAGTTVRAPRLAAVYSDSDTGGTLEFRLCTDTACANVLAAGSATALAAGATGGWTPDVALEDGAYWWQARSVDRAGNASAWSAAATFVRDTTAPSAPTGFVGVVARDGLTLRWAPPAGVADVGNYVVWVDGKIWRRLGEVTFEAKVGAFDAGDFRTFAVSAVDRAGNEGPPTTPLVGVPDLVGLAVPAAKDAVETRGLVLGELRIAQSATPTRVVSQTPAAPALAAKGSVVQVTVGELDTAPAKPLVEIARSLVCGRSGLLRLQVRLDLRSTVVVRILTVRGKRLALRRLGSLPAGLTNRDLRLPKALGKPGRYSVVVGAKAPQRTGVATARVTVPARAARVGARTSGC